MNTTMMLERAITECLYARHKIEGQQLDNLCAGVKPGTSVA
jgi:hypothetical protein